MPRSNVLVVRDDGQGGRRRPNDFTVLGVSLPVDIWREIALAIRDVERGDCDQVQIWKAGRHLVINTAHLKPVKGEINP